MIRKIAAKHTPRLPLSPRVPEDLARYQETKRDMEWVYERWAEILRDYAGKCIAVANRELFVADKISDAYRQARVKYPQLIPFVFAVSSYSGKRIR